MKKSAEDTPRVGKMAQSCRDSEPPIPIVFAADDSYVPYASAAIASILSSSRCDREYAVYILHSGLSRKAAERLEGICAENLSVRCVDLSLRIAEYRDHMYSHSYFSAEMYYRMLVPEVLADCDKVIYLDCDVIVLGDLCELYSTDVSGYTAAVCRNPMHERMRSYVSGELGLDPQGYFNSGVMLLNCRELRKRNIPQAFFNTLSERVGLRYPDQDILNLLLAGTVYYLPLRWNYLWHLERLLKSGDPDLHLGARDLSDYRAASDDIAVLHYTGDMKPWDYDAIPGAEIFFGFADVCAFREEIARRFAERGRRVERIKLVFADVVGGVIRLTCAYNRPERVAPRKVSYTVSDTSHDAKYFHKRQVTVDSVRVVQQLFRVDVPMTEILRGEVRVSFNVGRGRVLFEYEKFFPLNGIRESYFTVDGVAVFRSGRELALARCTPMKKLRLELRYLRSMLSVGGTARKYAAVRVLYYLLRGFFGNVWLISDRPGVAGDNGEALFRFIRKSPAYRRKIDAYFIIDKKSPDYKRLSPLGRVIPLGSLRHKMLALFARGRAVSQTDSLLYDTLVRGYVKDIFNKQKRVFLQHGITKDDISRSYSRYLQNFDLFVTASGREYRGIVENPDYGLDTSRVATLGFPRHDMLVREGGGLVLVAPTWRLRLTPELGTDMQSFLSSEYYRRWSELLADPALLEICSRYGYRIVFLPHNKIMPFISAFDGLPDEIEQLRDAISYSEIISCASVMITDYSSNAFEMLYCKKPVLYYQFDRASFYGSHTYAKGYYDYGTDSLGDVFSGRDELLRALEHTLGADCKMKPIYAERAEKFFAYRDGKCSERVAEAILRLSGL